MKAAPGRAASMRFAVTRQSLVRLVMIAAAAASLAACASGPRYAAQPQAQAAPGQKVGRPYQINGVWYTPKVQPNYNEVGLASWYGREHQGKPTANGERFDLNRISGAHTTLPLPSIVEVTNLENGKRLKVRVNDRGPFVRGRIIDLSQEAARELGFETKGLAKVRVRYLGAGETRTAMMDARVE
jgi:rare lipoprotein A